MQRDADGRPSVPWESTYFGHDGTPPSSPGVGNLSSRGEVEANARMAQLALDATSSRRSTGRFSASTPALPPPVPVSPRLEQPSGADGANSLSPKAPSFLGSSFSRFTGFYSPLLNKPMRKETDFELMRDSELTEEMERESKEQQAHKKRKDWMKSYQDEAIRFASVTRSTGKVAAKA